MTRVLPTHERLHSKTVRRGRPHDGAYCPCARRKQGTLLTTAQRPNRHPTTATVRRLTVILSMAKDLARACTPTEILRRTQDDTCFTGPETATTKDRAVDREYSSSTPRFSPVQQWNKSAVIRQGRYPAAHSDVPFRRRNAPKGSNKITFRHRPQDQICAARRESAMSCWEISGRDHNIRARSFGDLLKNPSARQEISADVPQPLNENISARSASSVASPPTWFFAFVRQPLLCQRQTAILFAILRPNAHVSRLFGDKPRFLEAKSTKFHKRRPYKTMPPCDRLRARSRDESPHSPRRTISKCQG
jgi:hypothetical protein